MTLLGNQLVTISWCRRAQGMEESRGLVLRGSGRCFQMIDATGALSLLQS